MKDKTKITTLRLPCDLALVARVNGEPVSELVREAVKKTVAEHKTDPDFQARLNERRATEVEAFNRLARDSGA